MIIPPIDFSKALRALRKSHLERGITQQQAAARLGCSRVVVSQHENGVRPSLRMLQGYAALYEIPLSKLISLAEFMTPTLKKPHLWADRICFDAYCRHLHREAATAIRELDLVPSSPEESDLSGEVNYIKDAHSAPIELRGPSRGDRGEDASAPSQLDLFEE